MFNVDDPHRMLIDLVLWNISKENAERRALGMSVGGLDVARHQVRTRLADVDRDVMVRFTNEQEQHLLAD